jgi:SAM-dependent methyltransferase
LEAFIERAQHAHGIASIAPRSSVRQLAPESRLWRISADPHVRSDINRHIRLDMVVHSSAMVSRIYAMACGVQCKVTGEDKMTANVNAKELEAKVKEMYRAVAEDPRGDFHFEMGRVMAERLGYAPADLDRIPAPAIESFAGVGYFFDLAELKPGETVLDLGSGSGMDTFVASLKVGSSGRVLGVDMTDEQLAKAERLRKEGRFTNITYQKGYIEETGVVSGSVDCVISNGVINLAPEKGRVFREAARVLKSGGRLSISDIVTDAALPDSVVCNADLWAACIGGAAQRDAYRGSIEGAGLKVVTVKENPSYRFISDRAQGATTKFGVKSVSILARKP